jgi:hypothetical protein
MCDNARKGNESDTLWALFMVNARKKQKKTKKK